MLTVSELDKMLVKNLEDISKAEENGERLNHVGNLWKRRATLLAEIGIAENMNGHVINPVVIERGNE